MASRSRSIEPKTPCSASVLCGGTRSNGITRMGFLQVSGCLYYRTNVCLFQGVLRADPLFELVGNPVDSLVGNVVIYHKIRGISGGQPGDGLAAHLLPTTLTSTRTSRPGGG